MSHITSLLRWLCCLLSLGWGSVASSSTLALPDNWEAITLKSGVWEVAASRLMCEMRPSQSGMAPISGFYREAGKHLQFSTPWSIPEQPKAGDKRFDPGMAERGYGVWVLHPAWKQNQHTLWLGQADYDVMPFESPRATAGRGLTQAMLNFLNNGQPLWVQAMDRGRSLAPPTGYLISNIGFRVAYQQFSQCLAQLLPKGFDQLERLSLKYQVKNELLTRNHKRQLDQIIGYMKEDPAVQGLYIDAHTDSKGTRRDNLAVSERRAQRVSDYLRSLGVPAHKMRVRWHGERYPLASNKTTKGRNQNRRVTVRMSKTPLVAPASVESLNVVQSGFSVERDGTAALLNAAKPSSEESSLKIQSSSSHSRIGPDE